MNQRVRESIRKALQEGEVSYWRLLRKVDYSLPEVVGELRRMLETGEVIWNEEKKRLRLARREEEEPSYECPRCEGRGMVLEGIFKKAFKEYEEIIRERPQPIPEFDQGFIIPPDVALKALFMEERGDIQGKEILILGDDDLLSIYLGLLGKTKNIVVFEIDDRLVKFIKRVSKEKSLPITLKKHDLSHPLPPEFQSRFHSFVSEPPESLEGFLTFLERGIEGLRKDGSAYVGLTTLESSLRKWWKIEKWILDRGMVITDILRNFSRYWERIQDWEAFYSHFRMIKELPFHPGPVDEDWYTASLIRLERVSPDGLKESDDLYMDEETWATPLSFSHED